MKAQAKKMNVESLRNDKADEVSYDNLHFIKVSGFIVCVILIFEF